VDLRCEIPKTSTFPASVGLLSPSRVCYARLQTFADLSPLLSLDDGTPSFYEEEPPAEQPPGPAQGEQDSQVWDPPLPTFATHPFQFCPNQIWFGNQRYVLHGDLSDPTAAGRAWDTATLALHGPGAPTMCNAGESYTREEVLAAAQRWSLPLHAAWQHVVMPSSGMASGAPLSAVSSLPNPRIGRHPPSFSCDKSREF